MKYNVYVVFGLERRLVASTNELFIAYDIADRIADRFEKYPICEDVIIEKINEEDSEK